jgi:hypothetical protein
LLSSVQNLPGFNAAWEIRRATFSPVFEKFYDRNRAAWTVGEPYGRQVLNEQVHTQSKEPHA